MSDSNQIMSDSKEEANKESNKKSKKSSWVLKTKI